MQSCNVVQTMLCIRGAGTGPAGPAGAGPMLVRETNFIEMKDRRFKQVSYLGGGGGALTKS